MVPIIYIILAFIVILAVFISIKKGKNISSIIKLIIILVYIPAICYMGIILPYSILKSMLKVKLFLGILLTISIIAFVYSIITLITSIKNKEIKSSNKVKDIYIRDIDVEYSPAVVSYLINGKIEQDKDLIAVLLNLCAEGVLKIKKDEDGKINIIDMHNSSKVEKLSKSDLIAYEMFVSKITTSKINKWKKAVYEEYKEQKFSKENKHNLAKIILMIYCACILIGIFCILIFGNDGVLIIPKQYGEIFTNIIVSIFFAAWEATIFSSYKMILNLWYDNEPRNDTFKEIYTKKGAREYDKWMKFKRFIKEFSNIDKADIESVVVLEKYLAYGVALNVNKEYKDVELEVIKEKINFDINDIIDNIINDKNVN